MAVQLPREIFRAYDIRGVLGEQITPERVELIASTFAARFLGPSPRVVLGRDLRQSSEQLAEAARRGLAAAGAEVWDIGVVPTPLAYFAAGRWKADGAVIITASHNPPEYNGMKLRKPDEPFYGPMLQELYEACLNPPPAPGGGRVVERDAYAEYFDVALSHLPAGLGLRVLLDLGNGCGAFTAPELLRRMGCEVDLLFEEPDGGQFRGRGPNPLERCALRALQEKMRWGNYDVGLAIDADGDRLAVVDEHGRAVPADVAALLIIRQMLQEGETTFVTEVRCSRAVQEYIEQRGGQLVMAACGYPFILQKMRETGAAMGFETTGHYYFRNPDIKYDDASFAAGKIVAAIAQSGMSVSELLAEVPVYYPSDELRSKAPDEIKFEIVQQARSRLERSGFRQTIDVDGIRVEFDDGWVLLRASNTAPELVMRWEGRTPSRRDQLGAALKDVLNQLGICVDSTGE